MSTAVKIIKMNGGDAFIEIGKEHIRIGVGNEVYFVLDKNNINAGASKVNWQMEPNKMTYQGLLTHVQAIPGLFPMGPKYNLNFDIINAVLNTAMSLSSASAAVGIGI